MSTLRVDNIKSRTGTAVTIPSGQSLDVSGDVNVTGGLEVSGSSNFNTTGIITAGQFRTTAGVGVTENITAGVITATTFKGTLDGTSTGLTGTPDITVQNITGVAATFTGVLTYADVTNVDAVGIVTARGGFEIGAAGVGGTITSVGNAEFVGIVTAKSDVNVGTAITMYASAGIVSATSFSGDGSNLSGISAGAWTPIVSGLVDSGGEYEIIGTTSTLATSSYQMYRLTFYTEQTPSGGESGLQLQIYNGAWREDTNYGYGWISNGGSVNSQTSAKGILLGKMGRRFEGVVQFSNPYQTTRPKWFTARAASMNSDDAWSEPLNFQTSGQYNGSTKNDAVTGIRLRSIDSSSAGSTGGGQNFSAGYYLLEGAAIS